MQKKTKLGRKIVSAVIIVTGLYVVLCLGLTLAQRKLLYYPCKDSAASRRDAAAAHGFENWSNTNGQFIGWRRLSKIPARGQVLVLHGNAGCALDRMRYADLQRIAPLDVFILEYPGYDGRRGSPSQTSLFAAASEALQQLGNQCEVFLIGESLGTGVAAYLAGPNPQKISGVLLIAPYNNLVAVARHHMPLFPVKLMLWDKYPSDFYLNSYHGSLGVLLAGEDQVVPKQFGQQLYDGYAGRKKLWETAGAGHDQVSDITAELWKEVIEFWDKGLVLPRPTAQE